MRPKVYLASLALAWVLWGWCLPVPAGAQMVSGTYTGNGAPTKAITGLGFQPDVVFIRGPDPQYAVIRTSTMTGDQSKPFNSNALTANLIKSLDADGFTVGGDLRVNMDLVPHYWVAFKATSGELAVGSYTGDGIAGRWITVGFQPDYVIVMGSASAQEVVHRFSSMTGDTSAFFIASGNSSNLIQNFDATRFQIGSSANVNGSSVVYHYVAWKSVTGKMAVGSYVGDGTDNRDITGVGFQPEWLLIKRTNNDEAVHRPASLGAGDDTLTFVSFGRGGNRIQALQSGGFQVGSASNVNNGAGQAANRTFHWAAFGRQACPVVADATYVAASAVAQSNQATVYWSSPNPVLILRTKTGSITDAPANGKDYNADPISGDLLPGGARAVFKGTGAESKFVDTNCLNGETCYYKVFPKRGTGMTSCYATETGAGTEVNVTPSSTASPAWSYMLAGGSILKPGIAGEGTLHAVSNAGRFISLSTASGAESWPPVALTTGQPVQGWPTWLPVGGNWKYRKKLTIQNGQVGGTLTDFPVLISHIDNDLRTKAQSSGNDIVFTAADGTTKLSHQVEKYDGLTGQLVAWVKMPSVSSTAPTDIYMYYGNSAAPNQEDAANVWDPNFVAVHHLKEDPTGAAPQVKDSTWNANHGTTEGTWISTASVDAKVGKGLAFNGPTPGGNRLVRVPDSASLDATTDAATVELWIKWTNAADGDSQNLMTSQNRFNYATTPIIGYEWASQPGGEHFFYPWGDPASNNYNLASNPFTNGAWHHVAVTLDWATKDVKIHMDGNPLSFTTQNVNATNWTRLASPDDWLWGGHPDRPTRYFDGVFDEIRVSNVVRSTAYITTTHKNQNCPSVQACALTPFYTIETEEALGGGAVALMGDQSGRVYSMDTARAFKNWEATHTGADFLQAAPAAQVRAWSDPATFQVDYSTDVIFVATRNAGATNCGTSATNNKLVALRADTKAVLWTFNDTCTESVNWIVGMPYVDYTGNRNRVYVASKSDGSQRSLWVIDTRLAPATRLVSPCPACTNSPPTGLMGVDLDEASPTLSQDGATLYVGNKTGATGKLYAINAADLTLKWTSFDLGAGAFIKGFVWEEAGKLYFTTSDGYAWCLDASAGAPAAPPGSPAGSCPWKSHDGVSSSPVAGATTPLLLGAPNPGLYVGSYDGAAAAGQKGKLYRINRTTGLKETQAVVGNGEKQVGDVSTETWSEIFVGTSEGKIFKFPLPLP